jgi:putative ABC transport system permease protein
MDSLILANLKHRPTRTIISVAGVALGVCLTALTTGLVRGMIKGHAEREANVGAEIMIRDSGAIGLESWASLPLPVEEAEQVSKIDGVKAAAPVGQYFIRSTGGIGIRSIEGIPYEAYRAISGINIIEGRGLEPSGDVAIVDVDYTEKYRVGPGDQIELLGYPFRIIGVYTPESGPRIKMPLETMQRYVGAEGRCSAILVKCHRPEEQVRVAQQIQQQFPNRRVVLTRDLPVLYAKGTPALNTFLNVVLGLEAVISVLVILLTMYTTIFERTREIGILKSLGASKAFIATVIEREAFSISLIGVLVGLTVAFAAKVFLTSTMRISIAFEAKWLLVATIIGLLSGLLGALYPALLAANQDAVKALSYE